MSAAGSLVSGLHGGCRVRLGVLAVSLAFVLALPATAQVVGSYQGQLVIWLKEDWRLEGRTWPSGAVHGVSAVFVV